MTYGNPETTRRQLFDPIALVGVGCRLPGGVSTVDDLLQALVTGRDCITEIPSDRWNVDSFYDPDPITPGKTYVRYGGFLTDIDRFDAAFFGISDGEAARMDPQQRMALQAVWHALENAGQSPEELVQSNTGVFLAMMNTNNYSQLKGAFEGLNGIAGYDAMGDAMSITAGRISHFLGLEGPCFALDTACSGSMVATHLACQSILAGECDAAIVVGVGAILNPGIHIAFSKVGLMSRSGRCRAFDEAADGYIRGEGCMAAFLRRESLALQRGDRIIASIVSTAINQDGKTPALTAPNGVTQEKVIRTALARSGISASEIGYVEAHGTGTPVGDPIEMSALVNVYGPDRSDDQPLYVGSAKTNFGHIESGAGLLGLVKAALSLQHETIFPSLHFNRLNPNIDIGRAPIRVPRQPVSWPRGEQIRMAGVNSFGYSGTNAHAVLREAPVRHINGKNGLVRPYELVALSAKSSGALEELVDKYIDVLHPSTAPELQDLAFTAATGRAHLRHRVAVVGHTADDIREKLLAWREGSTPRGMHHGQTMLRRKQKLAMVFTGQGAQYAGMGRQLYETEPRFKAAIEGCAAIMDGDLGTPLNDVLFGASSEELLKNTRYVQPAIFAVEYALADLLRHWGVEPDFVVGHSVGEIVAACVAGILDLEDAARFVVARGRLMGSLPSGGAMLAIDGTQEQVEEWVQGRETKISIAGVNGPRSLVVSGTEEAVDAVADLAKAAGCRVKALDVSHAFHSPLMDPILDELAEVAGTMHIYPARIPLASNVTGEFMTDEITGEYWSRHVRQAVLFYPGVQRVLDSGCSLLMEIGPHPALTPAIAAATDPGKTRCITTMMRDHEDVAHVFEAIAALHVAGMPIAMDRVYWSAGYQRLALPLYPFRRDRHWIRAELDAYQSPGPQTAVPEASPAPPEIRENLHPLLGKAVNVASRRVVFETALAAERPWVDHRVLNSTVFPGTAYIEMAARGLAAVAGKDWRSVTLRDVVFERPLILSYRKPRKVTLTLENLPAGGNGEADFVIAADNNGSPEKCCRGRIAPASERLEQVALDTELSRRRTETPIGMFYGELRKRGLEYGASFSTVRELWLGNPDSGEAFGRISLSAHSEGQDAHSFVSTVLLDGCLHAFGAALETFGENDRPGAYVPVSIQFVTLRRELPSQVWSHVIVKLSNNGRAALAHIRVLTDSGEVVAEFDGLELRQTASLGSSREHAASNGKSYAAAIFQSRDQFIGQLQDLSKGARVDVVVKWLAAEVKDTLGQAAEDLDIDNLDPSVAFLEIGLDSLLVTELQRRIQEKLNFRFQPMQGLDYQSIESLAAFIVNDVLAIERTQTAPNPEPALSQQGG